MLQVGEKLGDTRQELLRERYQLQQKFGQNASRQTWLAVDLQNSVQEQVALKLLALSPEMQWDECKLLEREAKVLQRLNHPRIPKYRDYFLLEDRPDSRFPWFALVQSYIPGSSLQQLLDRGHHFSELQLKQIAIEILQILVYLHELKPPLLHRDIKPSNLIWGEDEHIYLVDFGAVQDQAVLEGSTFTVVGTYGYVPMEQFGGRAVPASDLYALGATLIHLIAGIAPADLPHKDGRIQFGDRVSLDWGFINWIGKLTEPYLADRFSTARQALDAFEHRQVLSPPITTHKPTGSKIEMKKSATRLEIKLPRRGGKVFRVSFLIQSIFIIPLLLISIIISGVTSTCFNFHLFGTALSVWLGLFWSAFGQTYLYFDHGKFEIRRLLFGLCYWRHRGITEDIESVEEQKIKLNRMTKGITIQTWNLTLRKEHQFTTSPLAAVERLWLIQEIQDWLSQAKVGYHIRATKTGQ